MENNHRCCHALEGPHPASRITMWAARISLFTVYFFFGALKVANASPAGDLARSLMLQTVGDTWFRPAFFALGLAECALGAAFLVPTLGRVAAVAGLCHLTVVSSPLVLLPHITWAGPFTPTLEGQYIVKNLLIVVALLVVTRPATWTRSTWLRSPERTPAACGHLPPSRPPATGYRERVGTSGDSISGSR